MRVVRIGPRTGKIQRTAPQNLLDSVLKSHPIPFNKIAREAQKRLKEKELDDLEMLYSIRLSGKERIWGKRENEAFYIIWWDPNHTVCPVQKKHT